MKPLSASLSACFLASLLMTSPPVAHAESASPEWIVAHALTHNPDLIAARLRVEEARGRLAQAGRPSNPVFETELRQHTNGREFLVNAGFSQSFPMTARLSLEKKVSQAQLEMAEWEIRERELRLATETASLAVDLIALDAHQDLKLRQLENSRNLSEAAAQAQATGEVSAVDVARFQIETQQLELHRFQLDANRKPIEGTLRQLLGMEPGTSLKFSSSLADLPVEIPPPPAEPHPALHSALLRLNAAREGSNLAHAKRWEDPSVGLFGERDQNEDAPDGLQYDHRIALRIQLPLPFWNRNQGSIQEAQAAIVRSEKEADAIALRIRSEIAVADAQMEATLRVMQHVTHQLLPKALQIEAQILQLNRQGGASLLDVLRTREQRLQFESEQLDATKAFHLARIRRITAAGSIPSSTTFSSSSSSSALTADRSSTQP